MGIVDQVKADILMQVIVNSEMTGVYVLRDEVSYIRREMEKRDENFPSDVYT